jgi:hypothetical protein
MGGFWGTTNYGGLDLTSTYRDDFFMAKFDPGGTHIWSQSFGGSSQDFGKGIVADGDGNIVLTGSFTGTVNVAGSELTSSIDSQNTIIAKFNPDGIHIWSQRFLGSNGGKAIITDGDRNIMVTGGFTSTANFGGPDLISVDGGDIYVAKYDSGGTHIWSHGFGGNSGNQSNAIATDGNGNTVLTGSFVDTLNFGGFDLTSVGSNDIFVAKFYK